MGYYSQGKLVMKATALARAEILPIYPKGFLEEWTTVLMIDEDANRVIVEYASLKMYDSYPNVAAFYAFLKYLDEVESGDYSYIELGKDITDITKRGNGSDLYVSRSIEYT